MADARTGAGEKVESTRVLTKEISRTQANQWIGTIVCTTDNQGKLSRRPDVPFFFSFLLFSVMAYNSRPSGGEKSSEKIFERLEPISHTYVCN